MTQIIDRIGRDHRNMRLLLDIVEASMAAYDRGRAPDFELLGMIADYMRDYPDLVHHPLEDLVFARLVERDPAAREAIGDLLADHRRLAELTRQLAEAIDNARRDVEMPRAALAALVQRFLSANRGHMEAEERHFLPRALARLNDEDWAGIDARAASRDDPVFGEQRAAPYLALHERILRLDREG